MAKQKKVECPPVGAPAWMASYGDMMSLLLCFFVLLFAMSTVDAVKMEEVARAMSSSFAIDVGGAASPVLNVGTMTGNGLLQLPEAGRELREALSQEQAESMEELSKMASDFKTYFAEQNVNEQVSVEYNADEDFISIRFDNTILFDLGRADLKPEARAVLQILAQQLANFPNNDIKVEGHTDNVPINTAQFPSNWELSAARAISVARFFTDEAGFPPERLSAEGFGEFRPEFPNDTPENRAKNRRVVLKVMGEYSSQRN